MSYLIGNCKYSTKI